MTAGSACAHLTMDDLQDYVTNNMRGILKSEEKWNVLDREKKKHDFKGVNQSKRTHLPTVYSEQGNDLFRVHERTSRGGRL